MPIIQRGIFVNGNAVFTKECLDEIRMAGKPCNLININSKNSNQKELNSSVIDYLKIGLGNQIDQRYKCKQRSPWYSIPGIWKSDGFFFKRSHLYPKLLANEAGVMVTDSGYRINMAEKYSINDLVYSFYNSLTLSLAELGGRYYGGGVLELTPNEFKSIALPYTSVSKRKFLEFDKRFSNKNSIEEILTISDQEILIDQFGIDKSTVKKIQRIKEKLTSRRLSKKKYSS